MKRRQLLMVSAALGSSVLWPEAHLLAQQAQDFIEGPPVNDIPARQLTPHVWMIYSPDGFPTPENRGMMANVMFVVTTAGVVVLDSGASLQIGEMAIRMIRKVTTTTVIIGLVTTLSLKLMAKSCRFTHCPAPSKNSKGPRATCGVA